MNNFKINVGNVVFEEDFGSPIVAAYLPIKGVVRKLPVVSVAVETVIKIMKGQNARASYRLNELTLRYFDTLDIRIIFQRSILIFLISILHVSIRYECTGYKDGLFISEKMMTDYMLCHRLLRKGLSF